MQACTTAKSEMSGLFVSLAIVSCFLVLYEDNELVFFSWFSAVLSIPEINSSAVIEGGKKNPHVSEENIFSFIIEGRYPIEYGNMECGIAIIFLSITLLVTV